ncbi:hypothetical protein [Lysinibacillus fusiformis]|uniref:hypothetical protein n=1 Tax=Lysinibacillus fusiformis TaxID=28031 RepID=UPI003D04913C
MLKKFLVFTIVFTIAFFNVFQFNNAVAKAESSLEDSNIELSTQYLDNYAENNTKYSLNGNIETYTLTLKEIVYELTYDTETELFSTKAIDLNSGEELDIEQLKEQQLQNGEVVSSDISDNWIQPRIALPLIPVAAWAFDTLLAMIIAASLVTVVVVAKDQVKPELIERLKDKNPTIIYRSGSGNGTNLTPRPQDTGGLSYNLKMPSGSFTATTIEAVNKTGSLKAIKDGGNHVSVKTDKASEMKGWIDSRDNANDKPHKYTRILQGISVKVK